MSIFTHMLKKILYVHFFTFFFTTYDISEIKKVE